MTCPHIDKSKLPPYLRDLLNWQCPICFAATLSAVPETKGQFVGKAWQVSFRDREVIRGIEAADSLLAKGESTE